MVRQLGKNNYIITEQGEYYDTNYGDAQLIVPATVVVRKEKALQGDLKGKYVWVVTVLEFKHHYEEITDFSVTLSEEYVDEESAQKRAKALALLRNF